MISMQRLAAFLLITTLAGCATQSSPPEPPQAAQTETQRPADRQALPTFTYRPGS